MKNKEINKIKTYFPRMSILAGTQRDFNFLFVLRGQRLLVCIIVSKEYVDKKSNYIPSTTG
jgi:hypothetical protein